MTRKPRKRRNTTPRDYYEALGVSKTASLDEIKSAYRQCVKTYHPDRNKDPEAPARFRACTEAYETLSDPERRAHYDQHGQAGTAFGVPHGPRQGVPRRPLRRPAPTEIPPWQPDKRSLRNTINEAAGFADKNFCLRAIYDESLRLGGELLAVYFWAFDGAFGRASFEAYCSVPALGFGGKVLEGYNGSGPSPYATKAVFATIRGFPGRALLVRLLGDDVADVDEGLWIAYDSPNMNPWNDPAFTRKATILVQLAEEREDYLASAAGAAVRGRRPSRRVSETGFEFFCPECSRRIMVAEGGVLPDVCEFCEFDLRPFRHWPSEISELEPGFGKLRRRNRGRRSR
jgi:curved DNA-binding protein CbpA